MAVVAVDWHNIAVEVVEIVHHAYLMKKCVQFRKQSRQYNITFLFAKCTTQVIT